MSYIHQSKQASILLKRLWREEDGQALVEYGLLTSIVALSVCIFLRYLTLKARGAFQAAANAINTTT